MPFAAVNNTDIYYEVHGEGPSLVFAHGSGGNHLSWWQQIIHFSKHYQCVVYDHRTFGRTRDEEPPKGRAAFAEDLKCLLDYLEIENTAIVAHSMGGRSGSGFALRNPGRVWSLILSGSNGGADSEEARLIRKNHKSNPPFIPKGALRAISSEFAEQNPEKAFLYRQIMRLNPRHDPDFLKVPRHLWGISTHQRFIDLEIPMLYITGELDTIVHPETIRIASELVTHSELLVVKGSGHSTYYEQPALFNKKVHRFLEKSVELSN